MKKIVFALLLLTSCSEQPIDNHKGGVIYRKSSTGAGNYVIIKYKESSDSLYHLKRVYVMDVDYNRYNVLDTIK